MLGLMMNTTNKSAELRCHNRIAAIMAHTSRYSFRGTSRLASDAKVAKSTICHLVHGKSSPLYKTLERIVASLEYQLARRLSVREVVSVDGSYPTASVCKLVGCPGCLPEYAFSPDGSVKAEWQHVHPGEWTGNLGEFAEASR